MLEQRAHELRAERVWRAVKFTVESILKQTDAQPAAFTLSNPRTTARRPLVNPPVTATAV